MKRHRIETEAVHLARPVDPATGGVAPALVRASTFLHDGEAQPSHGYGYTRYDNPNRRQVESTLAALEGGADAVAFASGNATSVALIIAAASGGRMVCSRDSYRGTQTILDEFGGTLSVEVAWADPTDPDSLRAAVTPGTRLVYLETPSNPLMRISDIATAAEIAHDAGALLAVDNTFATPVLQRPLELGADLVVHSATKFLGGHSDLLAGVLVAREDGEALRRARRWQMYGGAVPSPDTCWLLGRSLTTLPVRVRAQSATAELLVAHLDDHPAVAEVLYPTHSGNPGRAIAERQMAAGGAVFSFRVAAGRDAAVAVTRSTELMRCATSLGGVETLLEQRQSQDGPDSNTPPDLIRVSVGLEHADDLIADLDQALARAT